MVESMRILIGLEQAPMNPLIVAYRRLRCMLRLRRLSMEDTVPGRIKTNKHIVTERVNTIIVII